MLIDFNKRMNLYRDIFSNRGEGFCCDPSDFIEEDYRIDPREAVENLTSALMDEINNYRIGGDEEEQEQGFAKEYISPYVTAKDKAKNDKTKYVQEIGDLSFEYDWNLISYDNYNTYWQDPETYDFDFNLTPYEGVRGLVVDTTEDLGVIKESECELVTVKFLPKPYRYKNGIYYTENEMNLLASYRLANSVYDCGAKGRVNPLRGNDEAYDYIQVEIDKYHAYENFCKMHQIRPEWRDVHRHYGVWFSKPIITYDIWEEYFTTEDDGMADVLLESILSGDYFEAKRMEIEQVRASMAPEDYAYRAYDRHKDIYPIEVYHGRYFEEDETYAVAYGYDQKDGIAIEQEHELGKLLEVDGQEDSYTLKDMIKDTFVDDEVVKKSEEINKDIERTRHIKQTEEDLEFYKKKELEREIVERGIDKIEDPKMKAIRTIETRFDVDLGVETEIRPVLEKLNMMRFKPPVDREGIDWQNKYVKRALDGTESYEDLLKWRTGKFDERAKDVLKQLHDGLADSFNDIMKGGIHIDSSDRENARSLGLGSSDFDSLLGMGPSELDIDISGILNANMREESLAERVRRAQYTPEEMDSLGFSLGPDEESAGNVYARMTREELLEIPCEPWE